MKDALTHKWTDIFGFGDKFDNFQSVDTSESISSSRKITRAEELFLSSLPLKGI